MLNIEAHFDESGTDTDEITVAGYLFEAGRIDDFAMKWKALLDQNGLEFLHMTDFAPGRKEPYNKIENRTKLQMQFMGLIKRYAINGIVCNIKNHRDNMGMSYYGAAKGAVNATLEWANRTSYKGEIFYFFEAGATGQGLLDREFKTIANDPAYISYYRYAGHAFLQKQNNAGIQAADFLAWQYHNYTKKRVKSDLPRLDLRSLLRHPHHIDDECGDLPREAQIQSVTESRLRIETVHYLPRDTSDIPGTRLICTADVPPIAGGIKGKILACPTCMRAIAEDITPHQILSRIIPTNRFILRCYCGQDCVVPATLPPFVPDEF